MLPLGIAYLAAVLRERGHEVSVLDGSALDLSSKEIGEHIEKLAPGVVGVTASTPQIYAAWEILEMARAIDPRVVTLLGGAHPSSLPEESLLHDAVDFVFRGESEESIVEFADALRGDLPYSGIAGISFKEEGKIRHNPRRQPVNDLDRLPYPARDLFPFPAKYRSPYMLKRAYATILTSRGCPGSCLFCNKKIAGFKFRARRAKSVVDEMQYLLNRYGIEEFHIPDDCFTWDAERVRSICEEILVRNMKISWACANGIRVDRGSREMFALMSKAGCYRVAFGIESGDNEILRKMAKKINLEQVREAVSNAQDAGLATVALFMLGNYGENERTMQKTIDFAKTLKTDYAQFNIAVPFPGSALYRIVEREGHFLTRDYGRYAMFDQPVTFELQEVGKDLLMRMYKKAHREFYFRPSQMWFILKKRIKNAGWQDVPQFAESTKKVMLRAIGRTYH